MSGSSASIFNTGASIVAAHQEGGGAQEKTATTPRMRDSLVSTTMERSSPPMVAEGMGTSAVLGLHSPVARHRRRYHITYPHSAGALASPSESPGNCTSEFSVVLVRKL
ncbi:hypothetical protein K443DRAFT_359718 [Laccaria amethystina LaAM-08-1]|uniref:Uncharacterized protein n=1 Tax=Laccaria amethystina LaAM-08-1 TaxID=1095629 RepID=A0A0C9Y559_9AGAR|nr:hypothetical protein K443DRAFT_359718 [Laccaria amethystina LaAM-08-1]